MKHKFPRLPSLGAVGPFALGASRIAIQLCGLVVLIYAARTLKQDEMGIFALMSSAVLLATKVSEAGWCELATTSPPEELPPSSIFWCAIAGSTGVSLVYGLLGLVLQVFWTIPLNGWDLYFLMIGTIVPTAVASAQYGILIRDGRLNTLALIQAFSEFAGMLVCIFSLQHHQGNHALAFARLTVALLNVGLVIVIVRWLPLPTFSRVEWMHNFQYAGTLIAARIVAFINGYGAEFLIGMFLGLREVGIYRVASRIAGSVAEVCYEPLRVMGWSAIAAAANQPSPKTRISLSVEMLLSFSIFICLPIFVGLYFVSADLVNLVLVRADWLAAAPIISILALAKLGGIASLFTESSLSVLNKGYLIPRVALLSMLLTISITALSGYLFPTSISVAWAQLFTGIIMTCIHATVQYNYLAWRPTVVMSALKRPVGAVILMVFSIFGIEYFQIEKVAGYSINNLVLILMVSAPIYLFFAGGSPWKQLSTILAIRKGHILD